MSKHIRNLRRVRRTRRALATASGESKWPPSDPVRRAFGPLIMLSGPVEVAIFLALYLVYDAVRWIFAGPLQTARAHARWVFHLEQSLHVAIEGSVQRALTWSVATFVLSNVYLVAQLVVLPGVLIWLYRRSPGIYRRLRSTVIVTWLIALPIFAVYPVAPPRLAGIGIKDTVSHQAGVPLTGHSTIFYNPYAAVPSLHVGLAFAVAIAVAATLRHRWSKALALTWGPLVTVAVIATGNHYLFDAAAGLLVVGAAYALTGMAARAHRQRLQFGRARVTLPPWRYEAEDAMNPELGATA